MALSHGLCLGSRQLTILTPSPLFLTSRLCFPSQRLSSLEMCQLALSQMRISTLLPAASSFSQHHERNRVVLWNSLASHPRTSTTSPRRVRADTGRRAGYGLRLRVIFGYRALEETLGLAFLAPATQSRQ